MVASLELLYPTKALLAVVGLPASTYYYHRAAASKEDKYAARRGLIKEIFDDGRGRYGHRRVRIELATRHGIRMSGKTVLREMNRSGCICRIRRRKYQSYKGAGGTTAPNILKTELQCRNAKHGLKQSMSRKGNCRDNALVESFFGQLKEEFYRHEKFESTSEFARELNTYIQWYTHSRIKEKLNGVSPVQYRKQLQATST